MIRDHLDYWYDKDGNKVFGNKKRYNQSLERLLSNNPEDVISEKGIKFRKMFHPVLRNLLPLTTSNTLKVVKRAKIPKDRPIIFVANHGFRDDIALSIKTIKKHAYIVFASIPDFFYSIDGKILNLNGVYLMDRKDPESRKSLIDKIEYGYKLGQKYVIIFPEGVWNKDPNQIVLKLYAGAYRAAKKMNALIMPISMLNKDMKIDGDRRFGRGKCYSILGEPIDVSELTEDEALEKIREILIFDRLDLYKKYSNCKREEIGDAKKYWNGYINELIGTSNGLYDYKIEHKKRYDPNSESAVYGPMFEAKPTLGNAKVLAKAYEVKNKEKKY